MTQNNNSKFSSGMAVNGSYRNIPVGAAWQQIFNMMVIGTYVGVRYWLTVVL